MLATSKHLADLTSRVPRFMEDQVARYIPSRTSEHSMVSDFCRNGVIDEKDRREITILTSRVNQIVLPGIVHPFD